MLHKPFDYSLRVSRKAKYAKLKIKPYGGLEVVIPLRFPKKAIPGLLEQHAEWIQRQLKKQQDRSREPVLPDQIQIAISGLRTEVVYGIHHRQEPDQPNRLFVSDSDYLPAVKQLRKWVRQQAWQLLPPILEKVSRETGLGYRKIIIRSQKTRWGSCSSRGTISLNDQLLFVARDSVEYLMIHELCHTRHMNHTRQFWQLVEHYCPDFRGHDVVFNHARARLPDWILRDLYG